MVKEWDTKDLFALEEKLSSHLFSADSAINRMNHELGILLCDLNHLLSKINTENIPEYKKKPLIAALEKRIVRINKIIKTL